MAFLAPTSPPETGASMIFAPVSRTFLANSLVSIGEIELMSMTSLPLRQAVGNTVFAEQDVLDFRRVRQHQDDDVGLVLPAPSASTIFRPLSIKFLLRLR